MSAQLEQDLLRFFEVYKSRTADLRKLLPPPARAEWDEEIDLLRLSLLNRLREEV